MRAYLRLIRLPNVFTAVADIVAAFLIVRFVFSGGEGWTLAPLCVASACLYLSGMAFNDIADHKEDARTRPGRPIPAGQISLGQAKTCAWMLWVAGCAAAAVAGWVSLACALLLGMAVLMYNFFARRVTLLGVMVLGLCRFLNVEMGMSSEPRFYENLMTTAFGDVLFAPAAIIGAYAAGLTAFSAQEEGGRRLRWILAGWLLIGFALGLAAWSSPLPWVWLTVGPLALLLLFRTVLLWKRGTPLAARQLVLAGVLGICLFDAGLVLGRYGMQGRMYALGIASLAIPSMALMRILTQKEA